MANSIKEYPAVADATYVYTTPEYLESTDIKVYVDNVLQQASTYTLNNTALTFNSALTEGQAIRIERQSDASSRTASYVDGSLLNAETLDKDANQIFNVAQEAYDQSRVTNMAAGEFYYSSTEENLPENPKEGTLWYDVTTAPYTLKVWDGTNWNASVPMRMQMVYKGAFDGATNTTGLITDAVAGYSAIQTYIRSLAQVTVYINGVRLMKEPTRDQMDNLSQAEGIALVTSGEVDWWGSTNPAINVTFFRPLDPAQDEILIEYYTNMGYDSEIILREENVISLEAEAQGHAEDAADDADDAQEYRNTALQYRDAADQLANNPKDVSFTYNGSATFSARHYAETAATLVSNADTDVQAIVNNYNTQLDGDLNSISTARGEALTALDTRKGLHQSSLNNTKTSIEGQLNVYASGLEGDLDVVKDGHAASLNALTTAAESEYDSLVTTVESDHNVWKQYATNAVDQPFVGDDGTMVYSAKHWATKAAESANATVDQLSGWTSLNSETITTAASSDPVINSATTFEINAPAGVKANGATLPSLNGYVDLSTGSWVGSANVAVTTTTTGVFNVTLPSGYSSDLNYQVAANYNGDACSAVKVVKSSNNFTIQAEDLTNSYTKLTTGHVLINIYKF